MNVCRSASNITKRKEELHMRPNKDRLTVREDEGVTERKMGERESSNLEQIVQQCSTL